MLEFICLCSSTPNQPEADANVYENVFSLFRLSSSLLKHMTR